MSTHFKTSMLTRMVENPIQAKIPALPQNLKAMRTPKKDKIIVKKNKSSFMIIKFLIIKAILLKDIIYDMFYSRF